MTTPLGHVSWLDLLDIILVASILYRIILLIKGTIAIRLLTVLTGLFLLFVASQLLGFQTLYWILDDFFGAILLIWLTVASRRFLPLF